MSLKIEIDNGSGFCFGVTTAIEKAEEELKSAKSAIHLLGGELVLKEEFLLPESDINRTICIVHKKEKTSKKYPRKAGVPSKQPL